MTCDASTLLANSQCLVCLPMDELERIEIYLLCVWANRV